MKCKYCGNEVDNLKTHISQMHSAMELYSNEATIEWNQLGDKKVIDKDTHYETEDGQTIVWDSTNASKAQSYLKKKAMAKELDHYQVKEHPTQKDWDEDLTDMRNNYQFKESMAEELDHYETKDHPSEKEWRKDLTDMRNQFQFRESWDYKSFNDKVESFEALGFEQSDAVRLASMDWQDLSGEVQRAIEVDEEEKAQHRKGVQDAYNRLGFTPKSKIEPNDLDDINYNIINESAMVMPKYECELCNSDFDTNEELNVHYNDVHAQNHFNLDGYESGVIGEVEYEVACGCDGNKPNCKYCHGTGKLSFSDKPSTENLKKSAEFKTKGLGYDYKNSVEEWWDGLSRKDKQGAGYSGAGIYGEDIADKNFSEISSQNQNKLRNHWESKKIWAESYATESWADNYIWPSQRGNGFECYCRCKQCGAEVDSCDGDEELIAHYQKHQSAGKESLKKKLTKSYQPHVYEATETVSYAGEDGDFHEQDHPRADDGKFTSKGGGVATGKTKSKTQKGKTSKTLDTIKSKILADMGQPKTDDNYATKRYNQIKNLDGFPQDSSQLRGVGVRYKAPIMKAHLVNTYPDSKWSVKTKYYSGGSEINASWMGGGGYPYGANKIKELYTNSGSTDIQVDYFDVDNYVDLRDGREDRPQYDFSQKIYDNREERFGGWVSSFLNSKSDVPYETIRLGHTIGQHFAKGDFGKWNDIDDNTYDELVNLYHEFEKQEKKEGSTKVVEQPKATTPTHRNEPYGFHDIPTDPNTGEDLPHSRYNPNAYKYPTSNPKKQTKQDVVKAYGLMKNQKLNQDFMDQGQPIDNDPTLYGQPWQKGGEAVIDALNDVADIASSASSINNSIKDMKSDEKFKYGEGCELCGVDTRYCHVCGEDHHDYEFEGVPDDVCPLEYSKESYATEDDYKYSFDELSSLAQDNLETHDVSKDEWDDSSEEEKEDIEEDIEGE